MQKKAQLTMDFVAMSSIMLILLLLVIVLVGGTYSNQNLKTQFALSNNAINSLSNSAYSLWYQGDGSVEHIQILIPDSINLSKSYIGDNSIVLNNYQLGDAFRLVDMNVSGLWPTKTGSTIMALRNNGTHINIYPASMVFSNTSGLYINSSGIKQIEISNFGPVAYLITYDLVRSDVCFGQISPTHITLSPGSSFDISVNFLGGTSCNSKIHNAYIRLYASTSAKNYENFTLNIPITAKIS